MAEFEFKNLKKTYESFREPKVSVVIGGKALDDKQSLSVREVEVELTSGYEASIATITLGGAYDEIAKSFEIKDSS